MATLYDVSVSAINQHLKHIFADRGLDEAAVVKHYFITATDVQGTASRKTGCCSRWVAKPRG